MVVPELQRRGAVPRPSTPARRCASTSGLERPAVAASWLTSPLAARCTGCGSSRRRRSPPGRWSAPRSASSAPRSSRSSSPAPATRCARGANRRDGIGLVWKSVSRNKRCVTLDLRQAEGQELFHRLLDVSDVLVVGNRPSALERWGIDYESVHAAPPAHRDAARHRLRAGRAEERPPRLRHAGRGDERVRPRDGPARRAADAAAVHAGRRRRLARRHVRGDDGALPPRRARRRGPARRRQPDRAAGPAHRVVDAVVRPARHRSPAGSATASTPARPATPTAPPTTSGWRSPARRRPSPCGSSAPSTGPTWPTTPTTSTPSAGRQRAGEVDELVAEWVGERTLDEAMAVFEAAEVDGRPGLRRRAAAGRRAPAGPRHLRPGRRPRPRAGDRAGARRGAERDAGADRRTSGRALGRRQRRGLRRPARPRRRPPRRAAEGTVI